MKKIVGAPVAADLPYSAGVIGAGLCFVAGQFGTDADNRPVGDVEAQTALAIDHIAAVLAQAGMYTRRRRPHDRLDALAGRLRGDEPGLSARFPQEPPARVTIQVAELLFGAAVEIDAIAVAPSA